MFTKEYYETIIERFKLLNININNYSKVKSIQIIIKSYVSDMIIPELDKEIIYEFFDLNIKGVVYALSIIAFKNITPIENARIIVNKICNVLLTKRYIIKRDPRELVNSIEDMGLSIQGYSFLCNMMIYNNSKSETCKNIKSYFKKNNSDSFEEILKYKNVNNINKELAIELDIWYKENK